MRRAGITLLVAALLVMVAWGNVPAPPRVHAALPEDEVPTAASDFRVLGSTNPAPEATRFRVGANNRGLRVHIECDQPADSITASQQGRDNPEVWRDDCVEIFLDPGRSGSRYWHLIITPGGAVLDEYVTSGARDARRDIADLTVTVGQGARGWEAVVFLPWHSLDVGAATRGDVWGINVTRHHAALQTLSTWAPLRGSTFHEPASFGELRFGAEQ